MLVRLQPHPPVFGLKVFMDARMPVTHEEGDRYPLRPPILGFFQQSKTFNVYEKKANPVVFARLTQW